MEQKILEMLGQVLDKVSSLESKVSKIESKVNSLDTKVSKIESKVNSLDTKVSKIESKVNSLDTKVSNLDSDVKELKIKQNESYAILKALEHSAQVNKAEHDKMNSDIVYIKGNVESVKKDFIGLEIITSSNWNEIAKLKALKQ